ncbi:hypothetical protein BD289DRAFT_443186 [Coniella lustricola]|uniref:Uncharacterized protein n=1 Tax=Coniella lustricola TaxID=2025994 RepID=A0A2T2ZXB4_9PEZI|nr:hypothetical protein BD289DRAFT_443186 [Coniella lustricola]
MRRWCMCLAPPPLLKHARGLLYFFFVFLAKSPLPHRHRHRQCFLATHYALSTTNPFHLTYRTLDRQTAPPPPRMGGKAGQGRARQGKARRIRSGWLAGWLCKMYTGTS